MICKRDLNYKDLYRKGRFCCVVFSSLLLPSLLADLEQFKASVCLVFFYVYKERAAVANITFFVKKKYPK